MFNEIYQTLIHSSISVVTLFILARIMGKKQVSQLTFFDYVVGISIGSIAANFAIDISIGYVRGLTGIIIYALFSIVLSYISLKTYRGRKILDGTPTILIENGKVIEHGLKQTKMNINDLLEECRIQGVFNISEIELAILETSGKLSILLKSENKPLTLKDINLSQASQNLCINLIIDGKILMKNLNYINQDEKWLNCELKNVGITNTFNVLLAFIDNQNHFYYYLKNEPSSNIPLI